MISQISKVDFKIMEQDLTHREYEWLHIVQKTSFQLRESSKLSSQKGWMCMFWLVRNKLVLLNINKPFLYALILVIFSRCFPQQFECLIDLTPVFHCTVTVTQNTQMLKIRPAKLRAKLTDICFISSVYFIRQSFHAAQPYDPIIYITAWRRTKILSIISPVSR